MRIFGFEITRIRNTRAVEGTVWFGWNHPPVRLVDLDANQLRRELHSIHAHLQDGGVLQMGLADAHQRIHYLPTVIGRTISESFNVPANPPVVLSLESDEPQVLRHNRTQIA